MRETNVSDRIAVICEGKIVTVDAKMQMKTLGLMMAEVRIMSSKASKRKFLVGNTILFSLLSIV